jgi:hypothetical protein
VTCAGESDEMWVTIPNAEAEALLPNVKKLVEAPRP